LSIIKEEPDFQHNQFQFRIYRVPFFLEPDYLNQPKGFWESHDTRMIRRFGSKAAFDRVKVQHQLVPRAEAAGLTEAMGFTEENLSNRKQSSTLNAHRLVQYVTKVIELYVALFSLDHCPQEHSTDVAEQLYDILNRKHFIEGGILNDESLLLSAIEEIGLERQKYANFLATEEGIEEILQMVDRVHSYGIHSIPILIINGGQAIVQGAAVKEEILNKLREVQCN
jgi:predicted DsbA family dithiol-disulfide isomerase